MRRHPERTWQNPARRHRTALFIGLVGVTALFAVIVLPISDREPTPVEVRMREFEFVPSEVRAAAGQEVRVTNAGSTTHSLVVVGLAKGVELPPGGSGVFRLPLDSDGSYPIVCDIPGHAEEGMVGTLVIDE
jgi:plastocyanin